MPPLSEPHSQAPGNNQDSDEPTHWKSLSEMARLGDKEVSVLIKPNQHAVFTRWMYFCNRSSKQK